MRKMPNSRCGWPGAGVSRPDTTAHLAALPLLCLLLARQLPGYVGRVPVFQGLGQLWGVAADSPRQFSAVGCGTAGHEAMRADVTERKGISHDVDLSRRQRLAQLRRIAVQLDTQAHPDTLGEMFGQVILQTEWAAVIFIIALGTVKRGHDELACFLYARQVVGRSLSLGRRGERRIGRRFGRLLARRKDARDEKKKQ